MSGVLDAWDQLAAGGGCPFDGPRSEISEHWDKIVSLSASTLYLHKIQIYRGYSLLGYDGAHATRLDQIPEAAATAFMSDLRRAQQALVDVLKPDHVNVELLGNAIPHLHWHIIPRYKGDPRWGRPIWMTDEEDMPRMLLGDETRAALLADLRYALAV